MPRSYLLILIALTSSPAFAAIHDPVRIDTGMISGVAGNSPEVRVYRGIPFAAPPVEAINCCQEDLWPPYVGFLPLALSRPSYSLFNRLPLKSTRSSSRVK